MKSYLVLENGSLLNLKANTFDHNILGFVTVENHQLSVKDTLTGKAYYAAIDMAEEHTIGNMLHAEASMLGKVVTDTLPIDYHLYDLKTMI